MLERFIRARIDSSRRRVRTKSSGLRLEPLESRHLLATFTVMNANDAGEGSLRNAIEQANATVDFDTIDFAAELDGQTISLESGELVITSSLHIDASALGNSLTIDATASDATPDVNDGQGSRVFLVGGIEADLRLSSMALTGGDVAGRGGAIYATRQVRLNDTRVFSNHANIDGGGFFSTSTIRLVNSIVSGNTTLGEGGGLAVEGGYVYLEGTVLTANIAGEAGGAAHVEGRRTIVRNSLIEGNTSSSGSGGGMYIAVDTGAIRIGNTRISGNSSSQSGGGVRLVGASSDASFYNNDVTGNSAGGDGGGISWGTFQSSSIRIERGMISGNSAAGMGGGISSDAVVELSDSTLFGNTAGDRGGGMALSQGDRSAAVIYQSTISGNSAVDGGGISIPAYTTLSMRNSTLSLNAASGDGGGAHLINLAADFRITESTVSGNRAGGEGGALWLRMGDSNVEFTNFELSRSTIANNVADFDDNGERLAAGVFVRHSRVYSDERFTREVIEHNIITGSVSGSGAAPGFDIAADRPLSTNLNLISQVGPGVAPEDNLVNSNLLLDRLADNGGPTSTHALFEGSPAIDAGPEFLNSAVDNDQRGRPFGRQRDGDGDGRAQLDLGAIEWQGRNEMPKADAGPDQSVRATVVATLDGSGSFDPDGGPSYLIYAWEIVSGPAESILTYEREGPMATFAADTAGVYTVRLTVSDSLKSGSDEVVVTVTTNQIPVADASLSETAGSIGETVILDGKRSTDADDVSLHFAWSFLEQPPGSAVEIGDANTSSASFVPTHAGTYRAELIVTDLIDESAPVEVTIEVTGFGSGPGGEWYNADLPADVDGDIATTPVDVLLVINELNDRVLSDPATGRLISLNRPSNLPFLDVTNNGFIDPVDALTVINMLPSNLTRNRASGGTVFSGGLSTGGTVTTDESNFATADFLNSMFEWHQDEPFLPWPDSTVWS